MLQITLIDFLSCAKLLLVKARLTLVVPYEDPNSTVSPGGNAGAASGTGQRNSITSGGAGGAAGASGAAAVDPHQEHLRIWQEEMEKGYENLKNTIMNYLDDLKDSDLLMALQ